MIILDIYEKWYTKTNEETNKQNKRTFGLTKL